MKKKAEIKVTSTSLHASEEVKLYGLTSLTQVAKMFSVSTQVLRNYHTRDRAKFLIIMWGCRAKLDHDIAKKTGEI